MRTDYEMMILSQSVQTSEALRRSLKAERDRLVDEVEEIARDLCAGVPSTKAAMERVSRCCEGAAQINRLLEYDGSLQDAVVDALQQRPQETAND